MVLLVEPQLEGKRSLKDIKQTGGLSNQKYRKLYLTSAVPQSFMIFQIP